MAIQLPARFGVKQQCLFSEFWPSGKCGPEPPCCKEAQARKRSQCGHWDWQSYMSPASESAPSRQSEEWRNFQVELSGWSSGWESALQCRGCGFDPWLGNWDPTYQEATKVCTTTAEAVHHNFRVQALQWKIPHNKGLTCCNWERSYMLQLRPNTAKKINNIKKIFFLKEETSMWFQPPGVQVISSPLRAFPTDPRHHKTRPSWPVKPYLSSWPIESMLIIKQLLLYSSKSSVIHAAMHTWNFISLSPRNNPTR